jgi:hypothetical protein
MVALTAFEYRKIADVEPYNEFAASIPVQYDPAINVRACLASILLSPRWYKKIGMYIHHLPVTTKQRVTSE